MKLKSKMITSACAALLMLGSASTMAADYKIDKEGQHAFVNFKVSHLGYSYIIGRFNDFDGSFSHDTSAAGKSSVNVTINTKSLDTNHAERDKHLRGDEFLDTSKYPTITFASTGYMTGSDGDIVKGDLSMHGVTKPVSIAVTHVGEGKDPWGGYRSGFEGSLVVSAADYGLPEWVGDVEIDLIIEGVRQ